MSVTGLAPLPVHEEGKCEYLLLMSLCCSGVQQEMKILQHFQSAQLNPLNQQLRTPPKVFSYFFVQICQSSFMSDSRLRNCSSDTQMGDSEEFEFELVRPRCGTGSTVKADVCNSNRTCSDFHNRTQATYVPSTSLKS